MPRRTLPALLLAAAALSALPGCWIPGYTPGGQQASRDIYTYQSTQDSQKTVTLVNTATGQTVWQSEVPLDRVLVVRFYDTEDTGGTMKQSLMRWEFMTPFDAQLGGDLNNMIPVPSADRRRMDVSLRTPDTAPGKPAVAPTPLPPPEPSSPPPAPEGGMR